MQIEKNLESKGFTLVHSEKLGDIINPISWFRTPSYRLHFIERSGVSKLADNILKCGVQVVETSNFKNENHFFLMIYYDLEKNMVRIDEHDTMWTLIHKGEYQKPQGGIKEVIRYMSSS